MKLTRQWLIDFPAVINGAGGFGYSGSNYSSEDYKHRGCVINSTIKDDYAIKVAPAEWRFGLNLSNFTLLGDASGFGLRIQDVGWNACVSNVTCDNFKGRNLSVGYNQDIHFYNVTCIRSRNKPEDPLLHFDAAANYVYFHGCRFENANYLLNTYTAWQVHFDLCHFEVGYYDNKIGAVNEYRYTETECIKTNGSWVNLNNSTFVPTPSQILMNETKKGINDIPFFIDFSGSLSNLKFFDMINPSDDYRNGGIKFLKSTGSRSGNKIVGGNYINLDSRTPAIVADHLDISAGCLLHFRKQDTSDFFGFAIHVGSITGCTIAKDAEEVRRTNGYLQHSFINAGFTLSDNTYDLDDKIYKYYNEACIVNEAITGFHDFSGNAVINMAKVHPQHALRTSVAGSIVENLQEVPYGKEVLIYFNTTNGVVKFVSEWLITRTAEDLKAKPF